MFRGKMVTRLWVKASGTWLAQAAQTDIFVPVDLRHLHRSFAAADFAASPRVLSDTGLRPSIETLLHGLMPQKVVVHVHALEPLSYLVRDNSGLEAQLSNVESWAVVPYQKPGEWLARAVSAQLAIEPGLHTLLLENHGVVIGGDDVAEVSARLEKLLTALSASPAGRDSVSPTPDTIVVDAQRYQPYPDAEMHCLSYEFYRQLSTAWALYPDHVVFLGAAPVCYDSMHDLLAAIRGGNRPDLFFLKDAGVYISEAFSAAQQVQLRCYLDVITRVPRGAELRSLGAVQIAELLDWDAEKYRQHLQQTTVEKR